MRVNSPLARLQSLKDVRAWARLAGAADERGELGTMGTAILKNARNRALSSGWSQWEVDTITMVGLVEGRAGLPDHPSLIDILSDEEDARDAVAKPEDYNAQPIRPLMKGGTPERIAQDDCNDCNSNTSRSTS
jgi:hypothetical protein